MQNILLAVLDCLCQDACAHACTFHLYVFLFVAELIICVQVPFMNGMQGLGEIRTILAGEVKVVGGHYFECCRKYIIPL